MDGVVRGQILLGLYCDCLGCLCMHLPILWSILIQYQCRCCDDGDDALKLCEQLCTTCRKVIVSWDRCLMTNLRLVNGIVFLHRVRPPVSACCPQDLDTTNR